MWYILPILAFIYLLSYYILTLVGGFIGSYILRPLLWASLALITFTLAYTQGINIFSFRKTRKWEIANNPFQAGILIAGFQISLLILAGIVFGYGESPYSFTPLSILFNLFFVASFILGTELTRSYLIKKTTTKTRNLTLHLAFIALLFTLIALRPSQLTSLSLTEPAALMKFIGETIIPLIAMSLFATYLAYIAGALPALGYMGVIQAFSWFSPLLPDIPWAITALIGTIAPAIGFLIIQNSLQLTTRPKGRRSRKKHIDPTLSWTSIAIISVLFVFFSTGYFGVQPTVIVSGSMQPAIDVGDIVLIQETTPENIHEGDIIQYYRDNMTIIHRVHEIYQENNNQLYITKGDANDDPDLQPINKDQILGKAVFTIPQIGWIPITIQHIFHKINII